MSCRNKWTQEQIDEIAKINSREEFDQLYTKLLSVSFGIKTERIETPQNLRTSL